MAAGSPAPLSSGFQTPSHHDAQPAVRLPWPLLLQRLRDTPQAYGFQISVMHLVSWPSLTEVPEDAQAMVARICALLERRPTAGALLPLLLGQPEARVFPLIEALRLCGHVQATWVAPGHGEPLPPATAAAPPPSHSVLDHLWQRLHPTS